MALADNKPNIRAAALAALTGVVCAFVCMCMLPVYMCVRFES